MAKLRPSVRKTTKKGVRLCAMPASGKVKVSLCPNGSGRILQGFPNVLDFPAQSKRWLDTKAPRLWSPTQTDAKNLRFDWALNTLADVDDYLDALIWQDENFGAGAPIFNHPRAIVQTRRDLSAQRLSGVQGLTVPNCVRFSCDSVDTLTQTFIKNGFRYPVLVRPLGVQTGTGQLRIDGPADWNAALNTRWFRQLHFMTQFEDFQSASGLYFKARVVFVGGKAFIRHVKTSTSWQIHNRASGRVDDDRELEIVDRLDGSDAFRRICADVSDRIRLDFCGMDLGVDPESERVVLFECNPAMSIFTQERSGQTPEQAQRRARLQTPIETALDTVLRDPALWSVSKSPFNDLPPARRLLTD